LIGSVRRNLLNLNQLIGAKADVFCVDRALNLRNVAFQAYYDPPRITTASAYGEMNLDPIGEQAALCCAVCWGAACLVECVECNCGSGSNAGP
jgi:ethanolamine utilization microcompartment shell protein EutL